jgi:hypothetical protein
MLKCQGCWQQISGRGVLLKEHEELHDTDMWAGLGLALDGTHYVAFHYKCWDKFFEHVKALEFGASFMFFTGDVRDLAEVVLAP